MAVEEIARSCTRTLSATATPGAQAQLSATQRLLQEPRRSPWERNGGSTSPSNGPIVASVILEEIRGDLGLVPSLDVGLRDDTCNEPGKVVQDFGPRELRTDLVTDLFVPDVPPWILEWVLEASLRTSFAGTMKALTPSSIVFGICLKASPLRGSEMSK